MIDTMDEYSMSEIYRLGTDCLVERFGIVNMEKFLVAVKTNGSDYTWWRQDLFEDLTLDEADSGAPGIDTMNAHKPIEDDAEVRRIMGW